MGCILSFRWWAIGWRFEEVASLLDKGEEAFRILAGMPVAPKLAKRLHHADSVGAGSCGAASSCDSKMMMRGINERSD
jgi:hypothetical protein